MPKDRKGPPAGVVVGPFRYAVVVDKDAIARASHADGGGSLSGQTDKDRLTIVIDPDQADDQLADTVLHECLHAVMGLVGADVELGVEKEEQLVRRVSPVLLDLLRRNPKLVAWLTKGDADG